MAVRSRFNYILPTELADFIHTMSGVTNLTLATKFITDAERMVDAYVGGAVKFYHDLTGLTASGIASGVTSFPSSVFGTRRPNYWAQGGVYIEILEVDGDPANTLVGEKRLVAASSTPDHVELASGFDAALASSSSFLIHQESRFPRWNDTDPFGTPRLPDELKTAVAWQVEYGMLEGSEEFGLGDEVIATDPGGPVQSRTYGSGYSETRVPGERRGLAAFIAPKARAILRELIRSTGTVWA